MFLLYHVNFTQDTDSHIIPIIGVITIGERKRDPENRYNQITSMTPKI